MYVPPARSNLNVTLGTKLRFKHELSTNAFVYLRVLCGFSI